MGYCQSLRPISFDSLLSQFGVYEISLLIGPQSISSCDRLYVIPNTSHILVRAPASDTGLSPVRLLPYTNLKHQA